MMDEIEAPKVDVRTYVIHGRVQRVGFRWWVQRVARSLEIRGTVENAPDGSVRVVAAGDVEQLERLEAALQEGPPGARVESVESATTPSPVHRDSFDIVS